MPEVITRKNDITPTDGVKIICLSVLTNLFAELLTWLLVYRTKVYKDNKKEIDDLNKKLDEKKESLKAKSKQQDKKIKFIESNLKQKNFDMMKTNMISMFIIGLFTFYCISLFNGLFQGIIVAKLPFLPFKFITRISHRGILTNDLTDCSFTFLYLLCNFSFRPIIQKLLGFAPQRSANKMPDFFGLEDNNSNNKFY